MSQKAWANILKKNQLRYPDERVITFLAANYADTEQNTSKKALDVGFSSGRHLSLLNDYNFDAYGLDCLPEAVETAVTLFGESVKPRLLVGDIKDKPYPDNYFDVVLLYGVVFLRPKNLILHDLKQVYQMMKPGAKMIVNFRTTENWYFGKGTTTDGSFYLLDDTAGAYAGLEYTFLKLDEAQELLRDAGFKISNYERLDLNKKNITEHHSWWIFWVEK